MSFGGSYTGLRLAGSCSEQVLIFITFIEALAPSGKSHRHRLADHLWLKSKWLIGLLHLEYELLQVRHCSKI